MTDIETALTPISEARRMLAEAKTLPDLRALRDYATGAKAWAKARGMGICAENEATEVILRAEREIGAALIALAESGQRATWKNPGLDSRRNSLGQADRGAKTTLVTFADIGISQMQGTQFQRLALLEDDRFEAMLESVKAVDGARLAKANFYTAIDKADRKRAGADDARPTPGNHDFEAFRRGAYGLLGWEFDDDGTSKPTKNDLMLLPDDELRQIAQIIKAMAIAYNEARLGRGG